MQSQAVAAQITAWQTGIDYEVGYWNRSFETRALNGRKTTQRTSTRIVLSERPPRVASTVAT
jgi:hypothetical protein